LRPLNDALRNLNWNLGGNALGNTTSSGGSKRSLGRLSHRLLSFGRCQRGIVSHTKNTLNDSLAQNERSTSALDGSLTSGGSTSGCAINLNWLSLFDLLRGLSLDVGAKKLRQQCCTSAQCATNKRANTGGYGRTSHRAKTSTASHRSKVCTLTSQGAGDLTNSFACGRQQAAILVSLLQGLKGHALARFFPDLFAALDACNCRIFRAAEQ
jgi:hypothetical protein